MAPPASLVFTVRRQEPELLAPAKPTPRELKPLSDIDDQDGLRFQVPAFEFYRNVPSMQGKDPARVIKEGISRALVFYYPLAGRLIEGPGRKLSVDCTGEGILFVEADTDVSLEEFGDSLQPPFPCAEELLYDVPGSSDVLGCPLLLVQVTRLKCGGFIYAIRFNHTLMDAYGVYQFTTAIGEMARGARAPSTLPTWSREFLRARDPPCLTCTHPEYDEVDGSIVPFDDPINRSFFFGQSEISALRRFTRDQSRRYSTFDVLTACLWRCRTLALQTDPEEVVRMYCVVNLRGKNFDPQVPIGYYGNALAFVVAQTTARDLCQRPLGYALELLREAKAKVNKEHMQSLADLMAIKSRPLITLVQAYVVSDVMKVDASHVDYGWGRAVYSGPVKGGIGTVPGLSSFYIPSRNQEGDDGILVPICLPDSAMHRFHKELNNILISDQDQIVGVQDSQLLKSKL